MINNQSPNSDKIAIFRSYFRGREDIYPRRFENRKTNKAGYSPVCGNEWVRGICEKPKIKCADCQFKRFLPITDEAVRWHLSGMDDRGNDFVMGVYPMLLDETCFFLAVDFDKNSWEKDANAFLKTCHQMNLPAALERSRSGKGAHVWLFFSEAISATLARKLGSHILTETMEQNPDVGLESYDRFFPNQDTLPRGGFGNLIALPLQKKARNSGNSVFIDENMIPYEDQWAFLFGLRKINRTEIETIVERADTKGRVIGVRLEVTEEDNPAPWKISPSRRQPIPITDNLPKTINIVVGNEIYFEKSILTPSLKNCLIRIAAFQNPEFYKAQAMRLPVYQTPRIISCAHDYPNHIGLPRGCFDDICQLLTDLKIKFTIQDELYLGEEFITSFCGTLRPEQQIAADIMIKNDIGVLAATTAFGKTVIASWLISQRKTNTLILVHRKQLQEQWIERLATFLDLPRNTIGRIGGGRKKPTGKIDVALIQSLARKDVVNDIIAQYGHLIIDECHHLPAESFDKIVRQAKAKYITGLSATVTRKDGHHPIITMRCGPIRHRVNAKEQTSKQPFEHLVLVQPTAFHPSKPRNENLREQFRELYEELIKDENRNELICSDASQAVRCGRSPLILTERNEHLDNLFEKLKPVVQHLIVLRGGMSSKEINQVTNLLKEIPEQEERIILATGKFIGEGFDDARLDTLFLTLPVSWHGTIAQYVGRLHRLYDLKKKCRFTIMQIYQFTCSSACSIDVAGLMTQ